MSDEAAVFHERSNSATAYSMEVDHGWRITALSQAARESLGLGDEVIGVSLWEVFPSSAATYARATLENAMGGTEEVQFRFYGRELGSWFHVRLQPTSAGMTIILRDLAKTWSEDIGPTAASDQLLEQLADQLRQMTEQSGVKQSIEQELASPAESELWTDERLVRIAEAVYRHRREREEVFNQPLTRAQWDLMLDLYIQTVRNNRVSITSACIAADAPQTTGLRALEDLLSAGLITREADISDRRRAWVKLTRKGLTGMRRYLSDTAAAAAQVRR